MNKVAWRIVFQLAERNKVSVGVAKKIWWQEACKIAYGVVKFPVLESMNQINKEYLKL